MYEFGSMRLRCNFPKSDLIVKLINCIYVISIILFIYIKLTCTIDCYKLFQAVEGVL